MSGSIAKAAQVYKQQDTSQNHTASGVGRKGVVEVTQSSIGGYGLDTNEAIRPTSRTQIF